MQDQLAAAIDAIVPKSLDDIIRAHRDRVSIGLATSSEIAALTAPIHTDRPAKANIDDWRFIAVHFADSDLTPIYLLGNNGRQNWMTSVVTGVNLAAGLVATKTGSIYRLIGEAGEGEPPAQHLLHVCAVLHDWGVGRGWGVPHIFY